MADGHDGEGADWQEPYDLFLLADDFVDDVLCSLDMDGSGGVDQPPVESREQNVTTGPSGHNNLPEWPAMLEHSVKDSDLIHITVAADPPRGALDAGASATASATSASTSSAGAHQNALDCTGCQVLREVLHSNGLEATKLSIHGAAGVFYHAILEVYRIDSGGLATALASQSYMDFSGRDYVWVKNYLSNYAQQRAGGGYIVLQDSIPAFQDALCTSMACGGGHADDHPEVPASSVNNGSRLPGAADDVQPTIKNGKGPETSGPSKPFTVNEQAVLQDHPAPRSTLAIQRERASKLQLRDIARYFHLPIVEAATALGVCATVLKGTSRKFHIRRWPYRKVKSIDNQIAKLRKRGNGDTVAMREIERLSHSRKLIYAGLE